MHIDLNCDLGEGFAFDTELMPLISSANIACAAHAGDLTSIAVTLQAAGRYGVQIGAHPGFIDREHFGRRELTLPAEQIRSECATQVSLLESLALRYGLRIRYLKPHGALYNLACRDAAFAEPVVAVAEQFGLAVVGLPDSALQAAASGKVPFIPEGFADRHYLPDGQLMPRSQPNAFVASPEEAAQQALRLLAEGRVRTLCVHGDNPEVLPLVTAVRQALLAAGHEIRAFHIA